MSKPRSILGRLKAKFALKRLRKIWAHQYKCVKQRFCLPVCPDKTVLFILGSQRSGTNMTVALFEEDFRTKTYGEYSVLSSQDRAEKLCLNPPEDVKSHLAKDRAPIIVLKPLVESHGALALLEAYPNSKVLWSFRHYKDVVSSAVKNFKGSTLIFNLRTIVEQSPNWRNKNVGPEVREVVVRHFSADMPPFDAAALSWWVRNTFFFSQKLADNSRARMCKYEDLVVDPPKIMGQIYDFLGHDMPADCGYGQSHTRSLGKGKHVELSPAIKELCDDMWAKLNEAYDNQQMEERVPDTKSG